MRIEKRIKLENNIYYVVVDVEYKINESGITTLFLKNYKENYFDNGNFTLLIEKIENNYKFEEALKYDSDIGYMADIIYIYDRIPFLSGIKDVSVNSDDILPYSIGYISKEEIDKYIEEHKITTMNNSNFKLYDENTWLI